MYSIAQLEARPSLTKELASSSSSSVGSEQHKLQQLSLNEQRNNDKTTCQKNKSEPQKVQKTPKSVRICEPKRSESNRSAEVPFAIPGAVPVQSSGFVASTVNNRPRSVTDALFAAAPEVAPPTAAVQNSIAPSVAVETPSNRKGLVSNSNSSNNHNNPILPQHSAEDMNKGFMPFAVEDPDLISEYSMRGEGGEGRAKMKRLGRRGCDNEKEQMVLFFCFRYENNYLAQVRISRVPSTSF